jgi:hypothetical protein
MRALTINHGAGITRLRYGDDGNFGRLRPARRARSCGLMRQRCGCVPPSIGCGAMTPTGRTPQRLHQAIAATGGVARVADIVEQAISSGSPVL